MSWPQCYAVVFALLSFTGLISLAFGEGNYNVLVPRSFGFEHKTAMLADASFGAVERIVSTFGTYLSVYVYVLIYTASLHVWVEYTHIYTY